MVTIFLRSKLVFQPSCLYLSFRLSMPLWVNYLFSSRYIINVALSEARPSCEWLILKNTFICMRVSRCVSSLSLELPLKGVLSSYFYIRQNILKNASFSPLPFWKWKCCSLNYRSRSLIEWLPWVPLHPLKLNTGAQAPVLKVDLGSTWIWIKQIPMINLSMQPSSANPNEDLVDSEVRVRHWH